jgi:hypothetical protein
MGITRLTRATRRIVAVAFVLASACGSRSSRADDSAGIAEQLFLEGRVLMKEGETEKACEKFQASHDADKTATGTLLNLALCNELLGRTASAWAQFRQVEAESAGRREDRVTMASEHEKKIFPKLSYLTISVQPAARVDGLQIVLDKGREVTEPMWSTRLPIDPGPHAIVVTATARVTRKYDVTIGTERDEQKIEIAPLVVEGAPPPPPPKETPSNPGNPTRRTVGYVLGGVGIVALGVGTGFGIDALSKDRAVKRDCPNYLCPPEQLQAAQDKMSVAQTSAHVSTVALSVGAAMVIGAAVLVWTARARGPSQTASLDVFAAPSPSGGGMGVRGAW